MIVGLLDLILEKVFFPFCYLYVKNPYNSVAYFGFYKYVFFLAFDLACAEGDF